MKAMFRIIGALTLLFDAYLLLAMVAIPRMKVEYHQWLPPFGYDFAKTIPRSVYIALIAWSGILALGCLVNPVARNVRGNHTDELPTEAV